MLRPSWKMAQGTNRRCTFWKQTSSLVCFEWLCNFINYKIIFNNVYFFAHIPFEKQPHFRIPTSLFQSRDTIPFVNCYCFLQNIGMRFLKGLYTV